VSAASIVTFYTFHSTAERGEKWEGALRAHEMPAFHFKDDSIGFKADPFEWSYIYGRSLKRGKTNCTSEISNAYMS